MKIRVTAKDIRLGKRFKVDGKKCPIARAIMRAIKSDDFYVGGFTYRVKDKNFHFKGKLSESHDKIFNGEPVKPFTFELSIKAKRRK